MRAQKPFRLGLSVLAFGMLTLPACGDSKGDANNTNGNSNQVHNDAGGLDAGVLDAGGGDAGGSDAGAPACDYRTENGILVIEAETLSITGDWAVGSTDAGYSGSGYIEWTGAAHNNDTTFGRFEARLWIQTPGLYRFQMRNRVGEGTNATEHNDTWVSFPDAVDYYGTQGAATAEDRVYPRPLCEDAGFMAQIQALPDVVEATCPNGTSRDGYFKVYCSGALDWKWSAHTSDSDAHDPVMRFDTAGVYTLRLAARGDHHQIDRIVIHQHGLDDGTVRDLALDQTACP